MFDLEAAATSIQLNNTALSDVVEIQYSLVLELDDTVDMFKEYIFMQREESNLTAIGLYSDLLVERLSPFAVARWYIAVR